MAIAIRQEIIIIDPNEDEIHDWTASITDTLERHTDWIVIGGDEHLITFEWDDDLTVNNEDCTFTQAYHELNQIGQIAERKEG